MAIECGYYDSLNGDRKYNAEQMCGLLEGLITDGVYPSVGEMFAVTPGSGLQVLVGTGRAWLAATWSKNKAKIPVAISAPDPIYERIDAILLVADKSDAVRNNYITLIKGTVSSTPTPPTWKNTDEKFYLPLAYVHVPPKATKLTAANIDILVGKSQCPFTTSILQQTNIDVLFANWEAQFMDWWDEIRGTLSEDLVVGMVADVTDLKRRMTAAEAKIPSPAPTSNTTATNMYVSPSYLSTITAASYLAGRAHFHSYTSMSISDEPIQLGPNGGLVVYHLIGAGGSGGVGNVYKAIEKPTGWHPACWYYIAGRQGQNGQHVWGSRTFSASSITITTKLGIGGAAVSYKGDNNGTLNDTSGRPLGAPGNAGSSTTLTINATSTTSRIVATAYGGSGGVVEPDISGAPYGAASGWVEDTDELRGFWYARGLDPIDYPTEYGIGGVPGYAYVSSDTSVPSGKNSGQGRVGAIFIWVFPFM